MQNNVFDPYLQDMHVRTTLIIPIDHRKILKLLRQLKALGTKNAARGSFEKESKSRFGRVEAFPKRKVEGSRESFLGRYIFDGAELVKASDDVVVGQNAAAVDTGGAAGD